MIIKAKILRMAPARQPGDHLLNSSPPSSTPSSDWEDKGEDRKIDNTTCAPHPFNTAPKDIVSFNVSKLPHCSIIRPYIE